MTGSVETPSSSARPESRGEKARFEAGELIGGRYRVVRSWGAGRLDEAYEVEDQERREGLVLKVLRRTDHPIRPSRSLSRLVARLARLRHPNVARVFELSVHVAPDSGHGEEWVLFVTSELVEGETLGSHVRKSRPLDSHLAASLIDQVCSGLAAAHRRKIVHGNLSSAAIILCSNGNEIRPVITDFDLSTSESELHVSSVVSPVYKAPETLVGRPSDRMSDVFSLGAVMYEILSGRIPFTGGNLLALDFRRLEEEPRPLRDLVEQVDPRLERVVNRCLSRGPEDRYASAGQVRDAIAGEEYWTPRTRRNVTTLSAAAALVVVMFGGSALLDHISEIERERLTVLDTAAYRPSFAVLELATPQEGDTWIAEAVSELIREDFSRYESIRVADQALVRELSGLETPPGGVPDPVLSALIRNLLDIEAMVIGTCSIDTTGGVPVVAVDICIVDVRTGETLSAAFERGSPQSLPELAARTAARLRSSIGVEDLSSEQPRWDPDAVHPWAEGLLLLRRHQARASLSRLEEAAAIQPDNARIQDALALAWSEIGSSARAAESTRRAIDAARAATPERELQRRADLAQLEGNLQEAIETRFQLTRQYPDRVSHSYRLIELLLRSGSTRGVTDEIRRLRMTRSSLDPRTEVMEARLQSQLGRFETARFHSERAAALAATIGSAFVQGEALIERARARASMGNTTSAWTDLLRAEGLMMQAGNLSGLTKIDSIRATLLEHRGELEAALNIYERIGERHKLAEQDQNFATAISSQATIRSLQGRHSEAIVLLEDAINLFSELDDAANLSRSLGVSGDEFLSLGRLPEAREGFAASLSIAKERNLRALSGYAHTGLARVAIERLDLKEAVRRLNEASSTFSDLPMLEAAAGVAIVRSDVDRLQGDVVDARGRLLETLERAEAGLDPEWTARFQLALAEVAVSSGDDRSAMILSERALTQYSSTRNLDREVDALTIALRAAVRLGHADEIDSITQRLEQVLPSLESRTRILRARMAMAGSLDESQAHAEMRAVLEESTTLGLKLLTLEVARTLESSAPSPEEREQWRREVRRLVKQSGADLFVNSAQR